MSLSINGGVILGAPSGPAGGGLGGDYPDPTVDVVAPPAHAPSHTNGSDDVQDATAGQKGVATAAQITKLDGVETLATADQTDAEIKTAYENNADTNEFSDAEQTKLTGIETSATADQTDAEIKTAYEANADTNEFSDTEQTKLTGIETSATADQTNAEIKTAYEANADTNEFSDAEQTKLAGIETAATIDQTAAEIETAYNTQVTVVSQAEAEAGTATTRRGWTAERVKQSIDALVGLFVENTITTINGTQTTITTATLDDDTVYEFEIIVSGRRTDSADRIVAKRCGGVFREAAGGASLQGTVSTPLTRRSSNYGVTADVSGNDLRVRVTGIAAHTLNWKSKLKLVKVS